MVSGTRLLFLLLIVVSVFCIVTSKHGHKKSHGPLRPGASKTRHVKGHIPKQHHHHAKKPHIHHHLKFKHHPKHRHEPHLKAHSEHHHHQPALHLKAHSKHKLHHQHQHQHQQALHLKAHKKGVTFAKSPAEPQACVDFLPCLQYRYYHCRSHEWIRNNCPKLCLYCEHQPFPEPMYGRFKTVAASYPDWCLDHSQCVAYPTEACTHDEWMRLNCLRKCDTCYKHKKVKAGILFVGTPFDQTLEQKKEEHQLDKILHFRPTPSPTIKTKDDKLKGMLATDVDKGTAQGPPVAIKDTPIPAAKPATDSFQASPQAANVARDGKLMAKGNLVADVDKGTAQGPPVAIEDTPIPAAKPATDSFQASPPAENVPVTPALPEKPGLPLKPNSPVVQQQNLAAGKLQAKPEPQPAIVSPPAVSLRPKAKTPVGVIPEKPGLPLKPNSPVVQQQNLAAGKLQAKPEPQPAIVSPPAVSLRPKVKTPVGVPGISYHDLVHQELEAARDAPSTKQFKADVLKQVQIKLKTSGFPQINTAKIFVKHKVSKPKRKHVVESLTAPKHKVSKPKKAHLKHKIVHKKTTKHVQKKEKVAAKKEELHKTKKAKDEEQHVKEVNKEKNKEKEIKEKKIEKKVEKKSNSHHKRH